ncbi:hypothetical protein P3G70_14780, partial [Staphylococcus aureus]|nr:hypothetical protein [Staphylococcus aureus]
IYTACPSSAASDVYKRQDVATKYSGDVNKKQQDKITTFLKKKGIDTEVFNK